MSLTNETRKEAREKVSSENRIRVLGVILSSSVPLGASEIAETLCWDVTSVRPRLCELVDAGQIEAVGKRMLESGRREATFSETKKGSAPVWTSDGQGVFTGLSL